MVDLFDRAMAPLPRRERDLFDIAMEPLPDMGGERFSADEMARAGRMAAGGDGAGSREKTWQEMSVAERAAGGLPVSVAEPELEPVPADGAVERLGAQLQRGRASAGAGILRTTAGVVRTVGLGKTADHFEDLAQRGEDYAARPIEGEQTWEELKRSPSAPALARFVAEQGIASGPEMMLALNPLTVSAAASANTGRIAQQRATNDKRSDATLGDLLVALPAGVTSALLDRFGAQGVVTSGGRSLAAATGRAAAREGATEAAQSVIEYTGSNAGTEAGFDASEALDQAAAGAVAGAGIGGVMHPVAHGVEAAARRGALQPAAESSINAAAINALSPDRPSPLDALRNDAVEQARASLSAEDRASPISDDLIAAGRGEVAVADAAPSLPASDLADPVIAALIGDRGTPPERDVSVPATDPAAPARTGVLPVEGRITSEFGQRKAPKAGASTNHGGIDIAAPIGTEVRAPGAGRVVSVGDAGRGGLTVKVDHGNGLITGYAHLSAADVGVGDTVAAGQTIARSGASGNVTGAHLHYSARVNGQVVDPRTVAFAGGEGAPTVAGAAVETAAAPAESDAAGPGPDAVQVAMVDLPADESEALYDEQGNEIGRFDRATGRVYRSPAPTVAADNAVEVAASSPSSKQPAAAPIGDGSRAAPIEVRSSEDLDRAAPRVAEPTPAQAESGNYRKAHLRVQGLDITIENPKGSTRSGVDPDGKPWSVQMPASYGYLKKTRGADGDQVDVYVGPEPQSGSVFVVDQVDADTGKFDEHKSFIGYPSQEAALADYQAAFSDGRGGERIGSVTQMPMDQFKDWLGGDTTAPAAESAGNQPGAAANIPYKGNGQTADVPDIGTEPFRHPLLDEPGRGAAEPAPPTPAPFPAQTGKPLTPSAKTARSLAQSRVRAAQRQMPQGYSISVEGDEIVVNSPDASEGTDGRTVIGRADAVSHDQIKAAVQRARDHAEMLTDNEAEALRSLKPASKAEGAARDRVLRNGRTKSKADEELLMRALHQRDEVPEPSPDPEPKRKAGPEQDAAPADPEPAPDRAPSVEARPEPTAAEPEPRPKPKKDSEPDPQGRLFSIPEEEGPVVATIRGDELGVDFNGPEDFLKLRNAAVAWYRANLLGTTVTMADGVSVSFTGRGLRETTHGGIGDILLRLVPAIPDILRKGTVGTVRPGDRPGIERVVPVQAWIEFEGRPRHVEVLVREHVDGKHRQYSLHFARGAGSRASLLEGGAPREGLSAPDREVTPGEFNIRLLDEPGNADAAAIAAQLRDRLSAAGIDDRVVLRIVDRIAGNGAAAGSYDSGLITVAMSTGTDPAATLDHEIVHALRDMGLFRPAEWTALASAARADTAMMESVRRRYPDLDADSQLEEAIADRYARWAAGDRVERGFVARAFERIRAVLRAIRDAFTGAGYRNADAVMAAIRDGAFGRRGRATVPGEGRQSRLDMSEAARHDRAIAQGFLSEAAWQDLKSGHRDAGQDRQPDDAGADRGDRPADAGTAGDRSGVGGADVPREPSGRAAAAGGGRLATFYHGTRDRIGAFALDHPNRKDHGWLGRGVYVTDDPRLARIYAETKRGAGAPHVMELHVRVTNPYRATLRDKQALRFWPSERVNAWTEARIAEGHDGVLLSYPDGTAEIAVFDPADIRSTDAAFASDSGSGDLMESRPSARERYMVAWHGSPHDFDRFSTENIGDGEGAQAYGWGLYFAGRKGIAQHYRRKLAGAPMYGPEDIAEYFTPGRVVDGYGGPDRVMSFKPGPGDAPWDWSVTVQRVDASGNAMPGERPRNHSTRPDDAKMKAVLGREPGIIPGRLYEVDIPEDNEFLLWDKPLNEQPEAMQNQLLQALDGLKSQRALDLMGEVITGKITGERYCRDLMLAAGAERSNLEGRLGEMAWGANDRTASKLMHDAGVAGIRYLDRTSRTDGDGTFNYVVFDDSRVSVRQKYSIPDRGLPSPLARSSSDPDAGLVERLLTGARDLVSGADHGGKDADEGFIDRWRTRLQDRMLPVARLQTAVEQQLGRSLDERENPYLAEELMSGRTGARVEQLADEMVEPLFGAMKEAGVTVAELESYLYARHASERNARIAAINPSFEKGTGSGMTDVEAKEILAEVERSPKRDAVKALAARVDAILKLAVDTRVEAGLLSEDDAGVWRKQYQHYVPLRGRGELDPETGGADRPARQSGISVKGKESRRAFGRESRANDILAYSILQAEEAIMRAEMNRVAQAFHDLAKAAPDPDFWKIDKVNRRAVWNEAKGQVEYRSENRIAAEDAPYTVSLKIDGTEHRVTLNRDNPAAVRVADAMRNLSAQQFNGIVRAFGAFTRLFSRLNTAWNPEFMVTNAFRDIQNAGVNLTQHNIKGLVSGTVRDWKAALTAPRKGDSEWARWRREFQLAGGKVYFNDQADLRGIKSRIDGLMARGDGLSLKAGARAFFQTIDRVNDHVENAVRLAAYKNAREQGLTKAQAASLARNATVNFTRRGQFGPLINSFYAFFNASVQGSATLLLAAKRSGKVRAALGGLVLLGLMLDALNRLASDDDDDGQSYWDKVPDHEKQRNLFVMVPGWGDTSIKIPLGLGLNAFVSLGRNISELLHGRPVTEVGADFVGSVSDAFNPVGDGSLLTTLLPTALDPVGELSTNRNFADKPIQPEPSPFDTSPPPPSERAFPSVSAASQAAARALNRWTGGTEVEAGAVSVSPEVMDYLAGFFTGGAGRFIQSSAGLVQAPFQDDRELTTGDFPFVRRVVGSKPVWLDKSLFYDRLRTVEQAADNAKQYRELGQEDQAERFVGLHRAELGLVGEAKRARKASRALRKERNQLEAAHDDGRVADDGYRERKDAIAERERALIDGFNARWNSSSRPRLD